MSKTKELAVYGKGGIGKSTVCANLSAALAEMGRTVLQIGCDPKHDSTRLLLGGQRITTALDYMRVTAAPDYSLDDILYHGYCGVGCVEAGGPKPGVGCAGRGIISTFELLDQFDIKGRYDITVYDVLGDVVCGGFAVPIRREYADTIFIVTSGEFMSLYAANNILRGILNYDGEKRRTAGIIYNRRNVDGEDERVRKFAAAVDLPIVAVIPRDDAFAAAERHGVTVVQSGAEVAGIFRRLAQEIADGIELHTAKPLTDEELEEAVLGAAETKAEVVTGTAEVTAATATGAAGGAVVAVEPKSTSSNRYLSKSIIQNEPLHGCAFNGAATMSVHIKDAVILVHAPKSCGFISYQSISSTGRRGLFERGALLPVPLIPNLESTEMGETEMVFGGMEKLESKVLQIKARKPKAIIVISSCPAGIIGDDVDSIVSLSEPDMPIVTIKADGNLAGDYLQGMIMSYTTLARGFIRRDVQPVPDTVNIVFEKVVAKNTDSNFAIIENYLERMGVRVNCRFLCDTTYDRLANFLSAPLNLLAYGDFTGRLLQDFFTREFGCTVMDEAFPVGLQETAAWLRKVSAFFGRTEYAEGLIAESEELYRREIEQLRPILSGKRLMIVTLNHELDWILKTALDVGIEIIKVGVMDYSQDIGFRTNLDVQLNIEEGYDGTNRAADIAKYRPDILLSNYDSNAGTAVTVADTIPFCPDVGFFSGLDMARRWASLIKLNLQGEWKNDEGLFRKHYA